jgi:phosphatidylserine/phosphatidylglycerophosphate/cardiolipin synthase-like enzyme
VHGDVTARQYDSVHEEACRAAGPRTWGGRGGSSVSASCGFVRTLAIPRHSAAAAVTYRLIQEPDAGYQSVIDLIRGSARSVRMTMYELADPAVVAALADARRRGGDVKVILDTAFHGHDTNQAAYEQLRASGVDVR